MATRIEENYKPLLSEAVTIKTHLVKAVVEQTADGRFHISVYRLTANASGADLIHESRHVEGPVLIKRMQRYGLLPTYEGG